MSSIKRLVVAVCITLSVGGSVGCSFAPSDARIGVDAPSFQQYTADDGTMQLTSVSDFMDHRCGSLDCHGNPQRNLQIWGCFGMRVAVDGQAIYPGCRSTGGMNTTAQEYEDSYRSLVGLEPAVMSQVVSAGANGNPDLLTYVRKARGEESHKGGMLVTPGDDGDLCITTWLTGPSNTAACAAAIANTP
jgi:hypothetical protein